MTTKAEVLGFLRGQNALAGRWFGDKVPGMPQFWWRSYLRVLEEPDAAYVRDPEHPEQEPAKLPISEAIKHARTSPGPINCLLRMVIRGEADPLTQPIKCGRCGSHGREGCIFFELDGSAKIAESPCSDSAFRDEGDSFNRPGETEAFEKAAQEFGLDPHVSHGPTYYEAPSIEELERHSAHDDEFPTGPC